MGNLKFRRGQLGVQTVPETLVTATRQLSGLLALTDDRDRQARTDEHTGTISEASEVNDFGYWGTGKYVASFTFEELTWFLAAINGSMTATQPDLANAPTAYNWGYDPPLTSFPDPKFLTLYSGDDSGVVRAGGAFVTDITLKGGDRKPISMEVSLLTRRVQSGNFAVLTKPTTEIAKSALDIWTIDNTYAGIGGTALLSYVYDWTLKLTSGIGADWAENGSLDMSGITRQSPKMTLDLTAKWNSDGIAERNAYNTRAFRYLTMTNSGSTIGGAINRRLRARMAGIYDKFSPLDGDKNGNVTASATLSSYEDAAVPFLFNLSVYNTISSLTAP